MWRRKEILPNISTLIFLPLRDHGLKEVTSLKELLAYTKHGAESLVEEIEANKGEGIAIWLDGWDEIVSILNSHSSLYERLISGEVLPMATIIVTSRPWATDYVRKQYYKQAFQHIEIVSSVSDQIDCLIQIEKSCPSSKSSSLAEFLNYLDKTPAIRSAMHTPMATQITLEVFHWSQETGSPLPSTVTDLYTAYTCLLVHMYLDNHPLLGLKSWKNNNFRDLPEPVNKMFIGLCQLAYEGLLGGQQLVFPDLPEHLKLLKLETLGLMQEQTPLYASAVSSYHYNHLSIQEFLSAHWILKQELTGNERKEMIKKCVSNKHFTMVMRFLNGQTEANYIPRDVMIDMLECMKYWYPDEATLFHWLFEGGKKSPVTEILGDRELIVQSDNTWTSLDHYVMGCMIARSNSTWDLFFYETSIDDEKMELFIRGLCTSEGGKGKGHIRSIELSVDNFSSPSLRHLPGVPAQILHPLKKLCLEFNSLDSTGVDHIAKAIPFLPELEVVALRGIAEGGAAAVFLALSDHKTLAELEVYFFGEVIVEDSRQIAELLSCSQSIKKLDLSGNSFSSECLHILVGGLLQNISLKHLVMPSISESFTYDNMTRLSVYLQSKDTCKLEILDLSECNIESGAAVELANGLSSNSSVKALDLSRNNVGDEGATALGQALLKNKTIEILRLDNCRIATRGGVALAASLLENTALKSLSIYDNALGGGEAIEAFGNVLRKSKTLKTLDIQSDTSLDQSDVNTFLEALEGNQTLKELYLPRKYKVVCDQRVRWTYKYF